MRCIVYDFERAMTVRFRILNQLLDSLQSFPSLSSKWLPMPVEKIFNFGKIFAWKEKIIFLESDKNILNLYTKEQASDDIFY